ncbi:TPA: hypothetical protein JBK36_02950 [Legionella pneumophila]|nr:hypothetical protein [Legionella pneumophila]HAU2155451.1 hypothetical protein [Legionella pneumophila]
MTDTKKIGFTLMIVSFTFVCSFSLILLGVNQLIKLAYQPVKVASKTIAKNQVQLNDINEVLINKNELTSSYLKMEYGATAFSQSIGDKKELSTLPSNMQDLIYRNMLLTEKAKILENNQDLQNVKPQLSIWDIWVWLWSIVIWTGAMIYKRMIESFADYVVKQIKKIKQFLSMNRDQAS